jgi:hypothetical protein
MRILVPWLKRYALPLALCSIAALSQSARAQTEDRETVRLDRRLGTLIRSIDDIKWQNITIYRLEDEYKQRLIKGMEAEDKGDIEYVESIGQTIAADPLPDFSETVRQLAQSAVTNRGKNFARFKAALAQKYSIDPDDLDETELQNALSRTLSVIAKRETRPKEFYLVTSREKNPPRLIALLGVKPNESTGNPMMTGNPWVGTELYKFLVSNGPDSTMYSELKQSVQVEGTPGLTNQMFVLRDLSQIALAPKTHARASYLEADKYQYVLTGISAGRPLRSDYAAPSDSGAAEDASFGGFGVLDLGLGGASTKNANNKVQGAEIPKTTETPYEISVGTDVIASFVSYDLREKKIPDPNWGIELRNGFDELNYPSIWGGRLTLDAILENIKIGAVLPQIRFGDSTIATSGIGSRPQAILGGYGIAMSGDFTAPLLDNSGLFNFYASYTFGEGKTDKTVLRTFAKRNGRFEVEQLGEVGYVIRYAAQAYYSFGFYLDDEARHLFRLKIGGTVYGVDTEVRQQDTTVVAVGETSTPTVFSKITSETVGGVSGKVEYMKGGQKIPYGASLQYQDQSLLSDIWLQFIINPRFDLKVGLKYFTPVFREPHAWENANYVVPSVSLKYHFGG